MLTAGPELDRRVAEAIGDTDEHDWQQIGCDNYATSYICNRCNSTMHSDERPPERGCFRCYSNDLNDAFWAAEKAGVFSFHGYVGRDGDEWIFVEDSYGLETISRESSAALAICAAILKPKAWA